MQEHSSSFSENQSKNVFKRIVIIGSQGALGKAFLDFYSKHLDTQIYAISRPKHNLIGTLEKTHILKQSNITYFYIDYFNENMLNDTINSIVSEGKLDLVILTTGFLQNDSIKPEKTIKDINLKNLEYIFYVNTFLPAIMIKHFLPCLNHKEHSIFAALSARVGSISDNRLGGWYSYRASKAALNMLIKSASIELRRINKNAIIVGLHPGTVSSALSEPFLKNLPNNKIFTPNQSVELLSQVLNKLNLKHSGKCFDWNNKEILP